MTRPVWSVYGRFGNHKNNELIIVGQKSNEGNSGYDNTVFRKPHRRLTTPSTV